MRHFPKFKFDLSDNSKLSYCYLQKHNEMKVAGDWLLDNMPACVAFDIESSTFTTQKRVDILTIAVETNLLVMAPDFTKNTPHINLKENIKSSTQLGGNYKQVMTRIEKTGNCRMIVFVFQLSTINWTLPKSIKTLLCCNDIVKIGAGIDNDVSMMKQLYQCKIKPKIDIQLLEKSKGYKQISLGKLGEKYLGIPKLSFSHRNSDWTQDLTKKQLCYAVIDGYITLAVYKAMISPNNIFDSSMGDTNGASINKSNPTIEKNDGMNDVANYLRDRKSVV